MLQRPLNIVFSGMIAADPYQGGATWAVLQYLLGLKILGHHVTFIEPIKSDKLLWHDQKPSEMANSINARYFRSITSQFGLENQSALLKTGTTETVGIPYSQLQSTTKQADLFFNISGMLNDPVLTSDIPIRIFLDLDPAFIQIWHDVYGIDMGFDRHTHFATIGMNIGSPNCHIPTCGRCWIKTLQPVVLEFWPAIPQQLNHNTAFTTIANWRGYGSVEHRGIFHGQKAHSFRELLCIPKLTKAKILPALAIHEDEKKDLQSLHEHGWKWVDPAMVANTPDEYRQFIQQSAGEIGIAKSGYVVSNSGWFSDRSACYLASGRPVIAQDTGLSSHLPAGHGFLTFNNATEAATAINAVCAEYEHHCQAARKIAENHLDSQIVLTRLIANVYQ